MVLAQPHLLYRSGLKWAELQAQLGRTVVALCLCKWNSGTIASGKTRAALKTSKFTTAWWLASNLKKMLLAIKCHINNQKSRASHTQRKTGLHLENWWLPTTVQLDFLTHHLYLEPFQTLSSSLKVVVLAGRICCTDLVSNGQNCKHSLEEQ